MNNQLTSQLRNKTTEVDSIRSESSKLIGIRRDYKDKLIDEVTRLKSELESPESHRKDLEKQV